MAKTRTARTLKHPVLKNVEYASIKRRGKSVLEIDGKDLSNIKWRDFQVYVGDKIGEGRFSFTIKFNNNAELFTGMTNAVNLDMKIKKSDESDTIIDQVTNVFKSLESKLNNATQQGGVTVEMLLASTKQGYDTQVDFLKHQIVYKDGTIQEQKVEITKLELELGETDKIISGLEKKAGWQGILERYEPLLAGFLNKQKFPTTLGASDPEGIPQEILQILGTVDYIKMKEDMENYKKVIAYLTQYVSILPQKG